MCIIATVSCAYPISLVYNLKIRRAFPGLDDLLRKPNGKTWVVTAVPIVYNVDRSITSQIFNIDAFQNHFLFGSLINIAFVPKKGYWVEVTSAIEHERAKSKGMPTFNTSKTGVDDIVIAGGKNIFFGNKKTQLSIFGLVGFPTTWKVTAFDAQDALVGTRFYGIAAGAELSHALLQNHKQALIFFLQTRLLHFFDRKWEPILPVGGRIQPGNVSDYIFALRYRHIQTMMEVGFNETIFTNQAVKFSGQTVASSAYYRHSFFARLNYLTMRLPMTNKPGSFGGGFLVSRAKRFNTKIVSGWINVATAF